MPSLAPLKGISAAQLREQCRLPGWQTRHSGFRRPGFDTIQKIVMILIFSPCAHVCISQLRATDGACSAAPVLLLGTWAQAAIAGCLGAAEQQRVWDLHQYASHGLIGEPATSKGPATAKSQGGA